MDDIRGIIQGASNPFFTGFQGLGIGAITDSAISPVTDAASHQTLQGINNLGSLSQEAQLAAASTLQDSAFAVQDGINSTKQWADAHPNITATAQTALSGAEAAGTVWGAKKVEVNPTKWDWVRNTDDVIPAAHPMQTVDGEMFATNNVDFNTSQVGRKIHDGAQGKHILNHNNYRPGRSPLNHDVDPQELLLGVHSGKYPIVSKTSRGMPVADFGKPIGVDASSSLSTNFGAVHTGKKGSHIVPHNPNLIEKVNKK